VHVTGTARALRRQMTEAERRLWRGLRDRRVAYKFRRQVPVGPYVLDFVCFEKRLVVEVDGGQHLDRRKDVVRDKWLWAQGFRVLRFWNRDVLAKTRGVLALIRAQMESPSPNPSPRGGRGVEGEGGRK
jgi:very-short-patch-repair endonuclease